MPDLAYKMKTNPKMKILLAGGYYDLATPYFEGVFEMHHLPIPKALQANISYHYYEAGHMIYVNEAHPQAVPCRCRRLHPQHGRGQISRRQ